MLRRRKFRTAGYFHRSVDMVTTGNMAYYVEHPQRKHRDVGDEEFYVYANRQASNEQFTGPQGFSPG